MKDECIARLMLVASLAAHAPLALGDPDPAEPRVRPPPAFVELVAPNEAKVVDVKPERTDPPPVEDPPPTKPKPAKAAEAPKASEPLVATPPEAPTVPDFVPAELTGTTLVSDLGASWSAPLGNGNARAGAIGVGKTPLPKPREAPVRPMPPRDATVPLVELSRKPVPPSLERSLERHYPAVARRQGRSGEAKVRARVEASGEVRVATVTHETGHGFGAACRAVLLESRWTAPLNHAGRAVATWVNYRCKFRVN